MLLSPLAVVCLLFVALSVARILTSTSDLASSYDFVIVGGGTAGSVIATRLAAISNIKILVIEAGGSNEGVLSIIVPFLASTIVGSSVDWNFSTVPQANLNNRVIPYPRGFVLGGSSSVNSMIWNRGSSDVWDNWAELTQDPGWSSDSIEPFYLQTSHLVPPADGHDTTGQVTPSAHGDGPVENSVFGFPSAEVDQRVVNTSKQVGGRFPFLQDLNAGNTVGIGYVLSSIGGGARSSAAVAYLETVETLPQIDILINTRVAKLFASGNDLSDVSDPHFNVVEMQQVSGGPLHNVTATKEIILSAGSIGTPQILLRSGIGPRATLQNLGVPTLVDSPDVGQHLADHPLMATYFSVNSTTTFDDVIRNATLFGQVLEQWITTHQGLFVTFPGTTQGFMRLPTNSSIFETIRDPSSGPLSAHTEHIYLNGFGALGPVTQPATGNFMTVLTSVASPTSRGNITISSTDPFATPIIDPAFMSTPFDIFAMVQAIKDVQTLLSNPLWNGFVISPFGGLETATTDDLKAQLAREVTVTIGHPVGTARMSPTDASWGVVTSKLLVKRASGLRIVDASIFPQIPESHPQAVVYTVAERAVDLIKAAHGLEVRER